MAGGVAHRSANDSGSAAAMAAGSRVPNRSSIFAGPRNACSIGYCWSSSIPMSRANGIVGEDLVGGRVLGDGELHAPILPFQVATGSVAEMRSAGMTRRNRSGSIGRFSISASRSAMS